MTCKWCARDSGGFGEYCSADCARADAYARSGSGPRLFELDEAVTAAQDRGLEMAAKRCEEDAATYETQAGEDYARGLDRSANQFRIRGIAGRQLAIYIRRLKKGGQ